MKKKSLLQNLPDRYCFMEHDGGYLLYDKGKYTLPKNGVQIK